MPRAEHVTAELRSSTGAPASGTVRCRDGTMVNMLTKKDEDVDLSKGRLSATAPSSCLVLLGPSGVGALTLR